MAKLRFIRYHEKHNILIIPTDLPCLHMQDNEPEQTCSFSTQPHKVHWLTRSASGRTGNPHCRMKAGMIVFTWLALSAKALTFLPSIIKSTSISGLIQHAAGPSTTSSGSWLCPVTQTFTSGHWFKIAGQTDCSHPPLWHLTAHGAIC